MANSLTKGVNAMGSSLGTVTVFGKIYQGVECLAMNFNNEVYTFNQPHGMTVGQYYLVTGSLARFSTCMEGKTINVSSVSSTITLKCLGAIKNPKYVYLGGNATSGNVDLVSESSQADWLAEGLNDGSLALKCGGAGSNSDHIYLNGGTVDGSVSLAPGTDGIYSGTHWQIENLSDGSFSFKCLGTIKNDEHIYLNGGTMDGSVGLAPETSGVYTGTHWQAMLPVI